MRSMGRTPGASPRVEREPRDLIARHGLCCTMSDGLGPPLRVCSDGEIDTVTGHRGHPRHQSRSHTCDDHRGSGAKRREYVVAAPCAAPLESRCAAGLPGGHRQVPSTHAPAMSGSGRRHSSRVTSQRMSGRTSLPFRLTAVEWFRMNSVECKSARRTWIRGVLVDIAAGLVTNLVVAALAAVAHLLF